jgi:hypothetical protein
LPYYRSLELPPRGPPVNFAVEDHAFGRQLLDRIKQLRIIERASYFLGARETLGRSTNYVKGETS